MKVFVAKAEVNISKRIAFIGLGAMGNAVRCGDVGAGQFTKVANDTLCKPAFGPPDVDDPNYNLKEFEPPWDCVEEVELPITFHVSTRRDPRTSRSQGGAVINYAIHSLPPSAEPVANICASGVAERHPSLRFGR